MGRRPKTLTSELASPVCFHAVTSRLPAPSKPSNEKTNVITCDVEDCEQSWHSNMACDAASTATSFNRGTPCRRVVSTTPPSGRTPTRTLTLPLTRDDSAIGGYEI